MTSALAAARGNIVDLATHLIGEPTAPVYVMTIRAVLPEGPEGDAAAQGVLEAAREMNVHCTARRDEAGLL